MNASVNAFIEQKRLKLNANKCGKIHIENKASNNLCPDQKVHEEDMKISFNEKYLGDIVSNKCNSKDTIKDRKVRGNAILSEMRAILRDIPLGKWRTQIGFTLRKAWFLNGSLFNSEVWSGYTDNDLEDLEVIDHSIIRLIVGAQAKVPVEMLYLETAELPIKSVISVRRLAYLHTILLRHNSELIKQIYTAMKDRPLKLDWITLVKKDMAEINMDLTDEQSSSFSYTDYKKLIKNKVKNKVFKELTDIKASHSKVMNITHVNMDFPQNYLLSNQFSNKMCSLLFNLRSKSVNEFKGNMQSSNQQPPCTVCGQEEDSQEHSLICSVLKKHIPISHMELFESVKYADLFGNIVDQLQITEVFNTIIQTRQQLRKDSGASLPGQYSGPQD